MRNRTTDNPVDDNPPPRNRYFCPYTCSAVRVSFCMCLDMLVNMFDCYEILIFDMIDCLLTICCSYTPSLYDDEGDSQWFDVENRYTYQQSCEIRKVHSPDIFFDYGLTNPLRQSEQTKRAVCPRCYKVFCIVDDDNDDSITIGPHRCDGKAPLNLEFQLERSREVKESPLQLKIQREKEKRIQLELKRLGLDTHDSDSDKNNNAGCSSSKVCVGNTQQNDNLTGSSNTKQDRTIQNWMAGVESAKVNRRTIKKQKPRPIIINNDPNLRTKIRQENVKLQITKRRHTSKATLRQADVTKIRPISYHDPRLNETVTVNTRRNSLDDLKMLQSLMDRDPAMELKDKNLETHRLLLERDIANAVNDKLQLIQFQQMLDDNEYFARLARESKAVTFAVIHERKQIPARVYKSGPVPVIYKSFSNVPTTRLPADYQRRHEDYGGQNSGLSNSLSSSVVVSIPESIDSVTSDDIEEIVTSIEN